MTRWAYTRGVWGPDHVPFVAILALVLSVATTPAVADPWGQALAWGVAWAAWCCAVVVLRLATWRQWNDPTAEISATVTPIRRGTD